MILLLDTHALLWWLDDDPRLGRAARDAIADENRVVLVSMASLWETAVKIGIGKLDADFDAIAGGVADNGFTLLPITTAHLSALIDLPPLHRDPFDRLLVAQARVEGLTIVTRAGRIGEYGVAVLDC